VDENGKYAILTDILGDEDHLGDMDFKVTGSRNGITACQMDIKVDGLSYELMSEALNAAKTARLELLDKMNNVIAEPREELKPHVPRMIRVEIPGEMIGAVIGPGGKVVQEMQKTTGATITIDEVDDKGIVTISSPDKDSVEAAREQVERITEVPEVGKTYTGKVVNIRDSGAFVEFLPGKDGYLHIGDIAWERIPTVDSVLSKGQEIEVQYAGIDSRNGKHRLNRKVLLEKPEGFVEERRGPRGGGRRDDRRGGGRRDDRRNNNRND
jgi:polyribonucleotide nucleotidyltransferase